MKSLRKTGLTVFFIVVTAAFTSVAAPTGDVSRQTDPLKTNSDPPELYTRIYKVDRQQMDSSLEDFVPKAGTNASLALRGLLTSLGLDIQPPKAVFYNEHGGMIWMRSTLEDLDALETLLQVLNRKPLQVHIRARFVELPSNQAASVLENLGLTNQLAGQFTGILTEPQARQLLKTLNGMEDVAILSAPEVTTLSGRQAQIQVADIHTIITGIVPMVTNGVSTNVFQTSAMPFGPVLDIVPYIAEDGHTVNMTVIPSVKEFVGYAKPDASLQEFASENSLNANIPLPRFRLRQLSTNVSVWDGQTVVLGGFVSETVARNPDGSEVRRSSPDLDRKQLLVFVTPTVIDQAGNRIQSEVQLPPGMVPVPSPLPAPSRK